MKKSIIWLLITIMVITFGSLLYFQIFYLDHMAKMRNEQFSESVMRSLNATATFLEREEALHFLEEDANIIGSSFFDDLPDSQAQTNQGLSTDFKGNRRNQKVSERYRDMQEIIRTQYLYQKGLLTEVILSILRESSARPIINRADSVLIKNCLETELSNNGLNVPFTFAVYRNSGTMVYSTEGYNEKAPSRDIYTISLFDNTDAKYNLRVEFPPKRNYIFATVRFIIPSFAFTVILLIIFIYTVVVALRQKKLTEMKTDFINNMTHELKTPISSISLAAQMLQDPSIRKSSGMLEHIAQVITDETKRLRFQVEKVLHMSVYDNTGGALKFTDINANLIISNVAKTFKLKVEKYGGSIQTHLDADNAEIHVDEMQFTNVIFNLLDNAVKYTSDEVAPELVISTKNISNNRLEIRIKDNGIGIRKDDLKKIFEKFYRVSTGNLHDVKGFGLGLAYVKKMITLFKGQISVESELGKGSTFIIVLPLITEE